jgi:dTDP-4-amino-4,6-dideoxygalactose transaminase
MDYLCSRSENYLKPIYCSNPAVENKNLSIEIEKKVLNVLRGGSYILADNANCLEKDFSSFIGTNYSIAVASGTDALSLSLRALDVGIDDEVITVSHTAVATVAAIEIVGAKPVLIDINKSTFTIDTSKIEKAITSKTRAIIAVHLYGHAADIFKIQSICKKYNLRLIEDVSQAHGAKYEDRFLGSIGDVGCFSCYPTKNLGACGDAGLVTTNCLNVAKKLKLLREYGWVDRISQIAGQNSRMDEVQAAILRVKLRELKKHNLERKKIASFYSHNLQKTPLELPVTKNNCTHVFHQYVVRTKLRNELKLYLETNLIFAGIHYALPVHKHPAYAKRLSISENLNNTETISSEILSLPIYPGLQENELNRIISSITKFFRF